MASEWARFIFGRLFITKLSSGPAMDITYGMSRKCSPKTRVIHLYYLCSG